MKFYFLRKELQKFYQKGYIVILSDLCNAIKKTLDKISLHWQFNWFVSQKFVTVFGLFFYRISTLIDE